tara:strand:+ start:67644 stop:67826 length:183 start_codon:yes stop_codon:yes gene_type:complete
MAMNLECKGGDFSEDYRFKGLPFGQAIRSQSFIYEHKAFAAKGFPLLSLSHFPVSLTSSF